MKRAAACLAVLLALASSAMADLTNPAALTLKETSPSRFSVELTLPVIQGRVLKARPVLPDACVIDDNVQVQEDGMKVVRTCSMTCDPEDLVGQAIGVDGLLGTSLDVQLTLEMLDGRTYVGQLLPTQAYYLVPPSPTVWSLAAGVAGAAVRQVSRRPELALLLLLWVLAGVRGRGLFAPAGAFAISLALGQWLRTSGWLGVSPFLPVVLASAMAVASAVSVVQAGAASPRSRWWGASTRLMVLVGFLYGGGGLPVEMVLSRSERYLALLFSALGTLAGLALVILCSGQLHALITGCRETVRERLRFWVAYLGGVAACAIGLYHGAAPFLGGGLTPAVPIAAVLAALVFGSWCGAQPRPARTVLPGVAAGTVVAGMVLSLRGMSLPHATLAAYGSLALAGLLLARSARWPPWAVLALIASASLYHGAHAGAVLRETVALHVAHATAMLALLAFLFLAAHRHAARTGSGGVAARLVGLAAAALAVFWRLDGYRDWMAGEVAAEATMGMLRLPVLTLILALAALLLWPRRRRFQPLPARRTLPVHWWLLLAALFTVSVAGVRVRNPFYTPRMPTGTEARSIMAVLLTDAYLAFNLPDEEAALDRLARNLSADLVPGVYLDSRRRLMAGTREGAEVTVKDVRVISVDAPTDSNAGDGAFKYPCKWVVTARVRHWQHLHVRQNVYVGALTIRIEGDRWKIDDLELMSEEREIVSRGVS